MQRTYLILFLFSISYSLDAQIYVKTGLGLGLTKQIIFSEYSNPSKLFLSHGFENASDIHIGIGKIGETNIREINFILSTSQPYAPRLILDSVLTIPGTVKNAHYEVQGVIGHKFTKITKPKLSFFAAMYGSFSYQNTIFTALNSNFFDIKSKELALHLGFVPKLQYKFNRRFFSDISANINFIRLAKESSESKNPLLSPNQQKNQVIDFDVNIGTMMRFSLGYLF
jgi:hypothetical protein